MATLRRAATYAAALGFVCVGCGSSSGSGASPSDASTGDDSSSASHDALSFPDLGPPPDTNTVVDAAVSDVATGLPPLPELTGVTVKVDGDGVDVTFDPTEGARDYRIYALPADGDVHPQGDGTIAITNAIYRCAGAREDLYMLVNDKTTNDAAAGGTTILDGDVHGYTRSEANDSTLGYVYVKPGPGRLPVYSLASPKVDELTCGRPQFQSSRVEVYTTDEAKRASLIAQHYRDDGVAFYVPAAASASTRHVYEGSYGDDVVRWIDGPEANARKGSGAPIFDVLTAADADAKPLRRVFVVPYCEPGHDHLVAGDALFTETKVQGDQPARAVHWSGLTGKTVLVVEALDAQCPYQGALSPDHMDGYKDSAGNTFSFLTVDDLHKSSANGEVFVNGQSDAATRPKAIARSYVEVTPNAPTMDFYDDFEGGLGTLVDQGNFGWSSNHLESATYDVTSYANETFHVGEMLGELWMTYADVGSDVNGKIRVTPLGKTANIDATSFLHVTTKVDLMSSDRRYPQIIVSDQSAPVQDNLPSGTTLIVQPKAFSPTYLQVQICDHRTWDVNNQCPRLPTFAGDYAPPTLMPSDLVGLDRSVKFDLYVSSARLYVFLDDRPYACTALPAKGEDGKTYAGPTGKVTVTLGDVLYHSGVDLTVAGGPLTRSGTYDFARAHLQLLTRRHFDDLGFSSGVAAPSWDESLHPCVSGN